MRRFLFCLGGSLGSGAAVALSLAVAVQYFFADPADRPTVASGRAEKHHVIAPANALARVAPSTETSHRAAAAGAQSAAPAEATEAPVVATTVAAPPAVAPAAATPEPDPPAAVQAVAAPQDQKPESVAVPLEVPQVGAQLAALSVPITAPPATRQPRAEAAAAGAHVSIHYRSSSAPARADAQQLAASLASSGFSGAQLRTTAHKVRSPVVRFFFKDDAPAAKLVAQRLRTKQDGWQTEDCTNYRKKPPAGTIEVWPADAR